MPVPASPRTESQLIEVFSSIQGEGVLVGCRQIFVRMAHCNLDCAYCDTPFKPQDICRIETAPGSEVFDEVTNPVAFEQLYAVVGNWLDSMPAAHHSLSVTGGEPLVQEDVLAEWLPALRKLLPIYLETNGTLPGPLSRLLPNLDWISMDLKLPSQTGLEPQWDAHREFLTLAKRTNCYVKAVVGSDTPDEELHMAARLVRNAAPEVTLILQPVTTPEGILLSSRQLLSMQALVAETHSNVRVIPQTHHFMSVL